jgi:hypothetical protein
MPKTKKLQKQIESKLNKLSKLLNSIDDVRNINSDDPETWDSDTLHNLMANLKEALELLDDKVNKRQLDDFGQPIVLEEGLCTLVDEYHSEEEGTDHF